jgi:SAM-dependent methyltransferase
MSEPRHVIHVIEEIAPGDVMYKSDPDHYFFWGGQALEAIGRFRALSGSSPIKTILDFPSGHGRVMRFLRSAFPDALITACDVDLDAVDFCARTFDAVPLYSTADLEELHLQGTYDLIWCGSLLTHVHADQWRALLRLFSEHLGQSGLLVLTTHGRHQVERLRIKQSTLGLSDWAAAVIVSDYERVGFGYQNYPGREGYGISLSSPSWVCSQIVQTSGLRLVGYHERGWGQYQDAVACVASEHGVEQLPAVGEPRGTTSRAARLEVLDIRQHLPNGETQGYLEDPKPGFTSSGFSMAVQGWILGPGGPPQAIQIGTSAGASWESKMNLKRDDIAAILPQVPGAERSGFRTQISAVPLPGKFDLSVQARFEDGSVVTIATISGRRAPLGGEPDASLLRPLMLTTLGRTGSTWALQVLAQHPSIIAYRPFQYEPRVASYWAGVLTGLAEPMSYHQAIDSDSIDGTWWLGAGRQRPLPDGFVDEQIEEWLTGSSIDRLARFSRNQIEGFYRKAAQLAGDLNPTFFIEKTWPNAVPGIIWDLYPTAREVVLIRDIRDMVASMLAFNAKRGFGAFGRADAHDDEEFILGMRRSVQRLIDSWHERADKVYLLRYEDLVLEPNRTVQSALMYLGLDPDNETIDRMLAEARLNSDLYEGHRTARTPEESIGRWRSDLTADQQAFCEESFSDLLNVLGYE